MSSDMAFWHICITIILIGLFLYLPTFVIEKWLKKELVNLDIKDPELLKKIDRIVIRGLGFVRRLSVVVTALLLLFFFFFNFNPFRRDSNELPQVGISQPDPDFQAPTPAQVVQANQTQASDIKRAAEKEMLAEKENMQAMQESMSLFRKAGKDVQDQNQ